MVCLRIGLFQDRPSDERHLAVWISPGDLARLVRCAIEAPGIRFEIVYGISNNTRRWWDLARARTVLGYAPQDDAEAFDLYVVDVNMPRMDGYAFVRELRKLDGRHQAPVVMVSTEAARHDASAAFDAGANGYLIKPARPPDLVLAAALLLGDRAAALAAAEGVKP